MITAGNCNEKGNNPRRMVMVRMTTLTITITLVMTITMMMVSSGNCSGRQSLGLNPKQQTVKLTLGG